jgi:hypothetical protein
MAEKVAYFLADANKLRSLRQAARCELRAHPAGTLREPSRV